MTLPTWPSSLNNLADRGSWLFKPKPQSLRTDFDAGPARARRRFTSTMAEYEFTVTLDYLQFGVFQGFVDSELAGATRWFSMEVFEGGTYIPMTVRFKDQSEPYQATEAGFNTIRVQMSIEARNATAALDGAAAWLLGLYGEEFVVNSLCDPMQKAVNVDWPTITEDY